MSKSINVCQSYSKPKVGRFFETRHTHINYFYSTTCSRRKSMNHKWYRSLQAGSHSCHPTDSVRSLVKDTQSINVIKPGIERVQALADISRSALHCHSNETRALIANPSVQRYGYAARYKQTDPQTQTLVTNIHFALSITHAKCNKLT